AWAIVATFTLYMTAASADKAADKPAAAPAGGPPPGPPKPGEEMKKLAPVIANYTWSDGKLAAGAMGPGSPEMPSHGKQTCHMMMGGLWAMCDMEDVAGAGKQTMKWQGHIIMGWDVERKEYRGVGVDNMG